MKVSGFTIARNIRRFDYPALESIRSLLPVVDELVVAVGLSADNTREMIAGIGDPKIRILDTIWDDSLREGGRVLAEETNKALKATAHDSDWCFYLQADEVLHEQDYPAIRKAMEENRDRAEVEGLLFRYRHFYGAYRYVGNSRAWYRNEIRVVRPLPGLRSYRDAQGFRIGDRKLNVRPIDAWVYHYGWVKDPRDQQEKQRHFNKLWHSDEAVEARVGQADTYDYALIDSLDLFEESHPAVMTERIKRMNWDFEFEPGRKKRSVKDRLLHEIEARTGVRLFEYKNYRLLS
jgi:glycosyltransferase involved in cell wall biosynthesis